MNYWNTKEKLQMKILDILLLPKLVYQKLTDRKALLIMGVFFVGAADVVFTLIENYSKIFGDNSQRAIAYNILIVLISLVVLGIADVMFFSIPLFDLFKLFKKEKGSEDQKNMLVKLAKVYITAHIIIIPIEIITYFTARNMNSINGGIVYLAAFLNMLLPFWFSAAITRGINSIYKFQILFKRLVFIVVLIWNYLLSNALFFAINHWATIFFK
jgi:cytochrome c biogenesis protein CcdA